MLFALGAASSLLDSLQSLTQPKSSTPQTTGFSQASANPFDISGGTAAPGSSAPVSGAGAGSQLSAAPAAPRESPPYISRSAGR